MAKRVICRVNYRGSKTYGGAIQADKIAVGKGKYYRQAGVEQGEFQRDPSLTVHIAGKEGFLATVNLVLPASVAVALGGILLSVAAGAAEEAEINF